MDQLINLAKNVWPIGSAVLAGLVLGLFLLTQFPSLKLLVSTIYRFFGGTAKWFRRKSLETEVEGTMNSFSKSFNQDYAFDFLPECEVQWVTSGNQERLLRPGKAIIKLSFSRDDHDLNFYNAALAYVETGLLPDTRPFLAHSTARGIDLVMIRMLLTQSRRNAIRIFNQKFVEQDEETRAAYLRLEESDKESLFRQLLLPELHLFGQAVAQKTPNPAIQTETERFIDWFHELATRPAGELTKLSFESENIKVGVILVADPETFDRFGIKPYLRRANLYASRDYQCIYILARGQRRADIAARVGRELSNAGGYSPLNKRTVTTMHKGVEAYLITCIALKPDLVAMATRAWDRLEQDFQASKTVSATVEHVTEDTVRVDVYGLKFDLTRDRLSSVKIGAAFFFFERDQELELFITACKRPEHQAELSNCDTATDPKKIVELVEQSTGQLVSAKVDGVVRARDIEVGWWLTARLPDRSIKAFLPRRNATYSRFISLEEKFPVGCELQVVIEKFDFDHGRLTCRIPELVDPWDPAPDLRNGSKVGAVVRQITENHATCEIAEGLEARLFHEELTWDTPEANRIKMRELEVSQPIDAMILRFDADRQHISISAKRLTTSEVERFFNAQFNSPVEVNVETVGRFGASVIFPDVGFKGQLNIRDMIWGYCERLSDYLHPGKIIKVKCLAYDASSDSIHVGIKQLEENEFTLFREGHEATKSVWCEVIGTTSQSVRVRIGFEAHQTFGYIHRSEASSLFFVDDALAKHLFRIGDFYHCRVKRFDAENSLVELSRKAHLAAELEKLRYDGATFGARIAYVRGGAFAYGDKVEGRIVDGIDNYRKQTRNVEVMIVRKGNSARDVEVSVT